MRPFPAKVTKQKETIFIRSDFFDQKIPITILPDGKKAANSRSPSTGRQTFKTTGGSLQRATSSGRTGSMGRTGVRSGNGTGNFGEVLMRDMTNMTNLAGGDSLGRATFSPPN